MPALLLLIAIAAIACGLGSAALGRWIEWRSPSEQFVYSTAAGLGILAYCVLAMGLLDVLRLPALVVLLLASGAAAWRPAYRLARQAFRNLRGAGGSSLSAVEIGAVFFLGAVGLLSLIGALSPPSANDWDGLSYHLAIPKIYLRAGGIHFIGWVSHSNFPFTWEMLYTLGLALNGAPLAKLFHWLAGALTAAGAYLVARQMAGGRAGLLAACAFAAVPLAGWEATVASNDLATAMYTLLALGAFLAWRGRGETGWLLAAAVLAGFAAGCKMTSLLLIAFIAAAAFVAAGTGRRVRLAAMAAVVAAAIASPWYIKSAIWTRNPVYPFFYEVFGGKYWSASAASEYRNEQLSFGMGHGPLALASLPWNLTMSGNRFSNMPAEPFTLLTQSIGPLFLAVLPLLWLRKLKWEHDLLLAYCAVFFLSWFFLSQHVRYSLPAAGVLAVLVGAAAHAAGELGLGKLMGGAYTAAGLAAVAILAGMTYVQAPATLELGPIADQVNSLPPDAKVIMYGETRGFYFDRDYMWGNHHHEMLRYSRMRNARDLVRAYEKLKVTHVLMTMDFYRSVQQDQTPLARLLREAIRVGRLRIVAQVPGYLLFEIEKGE